MNDAFQALEPTVVGVRPGKPFAGPLIHIAHGWNLEQSLVDSLPSVVEKT